jgi:hypothetical protein
MGAGPGGLVEEIAVMERGFEREAIRGRPLLLGKMLQHHEPVFFVTLRGRAGV